MKLLVGMSCAVAWLLFAMPASADKVPDLGKTKFKDIAKYLNLSADQQKKIKVDVDRIQDLVKQAAKQRGTPGLGAGGRTPVGGGRYGGFGQGSGGIQVGDRAEQRLLREQWQKEIRNRVDEIRTFLTPEQLEKFKAIEVPDILSSSTGR